MDETKQEEKKPAAPTGGMSSIMDILARRSAVAGSESESGGEEDEWD